MGKTRARVRVGNSGSTRALYFSVAGSIVCYLLLTPIFRWVAWVLHTTRNRFNGLTGADPKLLKPLESQPVYSNTSMNRGLMRAASSIRLSSPSFYHTLNRRSTGAFVDC